MKTTVFTIEGMHCTSCAMNIDLDLEDLHGVASSSTSYAKATTTVTYDEKALSEREVIEQIKKTGYIAHSL